MRVRKKMWLAVGLMAGAAALTGCAANTRSVVTPTPAAAQKATAEPASPSPKAEADSKERLLSLTVDGEELDAQAVMERDDLLLPLEATAEALGWKADSQEAQEETQTRRSVTLEREDSRITVSWTVSDNTAKNVSWQKDGLLIPVDARVTTLEEAVYVPSAFFEEAMDVTVTAGDAGVSVKRREPASTPPADSSGENG